MRSAKIVILDTLATVGLLIVGTILIPFLIVYFLAVDIGERLWYWRAFRQGRKSRPR